MVIIYQLMHQYLSVEICLVYIFLSFYFHYPVFLSFRCIPHNGIYLDFKNLVSLCPLALSLLILRQFTICLESCTTFHSMFHHVYTFFFFQSIQWFFFSPSFYFLQTDYSHSIPFFISSEAYHTLSLFNCYPEIPHTSLNYQNLN